MSKTDLSKWQKASVKVLELRYLLEHILTDEFTEEEKQSERYKQLMSTVENQVEYLLKHHANKEDEEPPKQKPAMWAVIFTMIGAAVGKMTEIGILFLFGGP